ncbi:MAG: hypothetical protein RLZZ304_57 [Actinomycetota bacterium]
MKKLLVAAIAAALTLGGVSAPAKAWSALTLDANNYAGVITVQANSTYDSITVHCVGGHFTNGNNPVYFNVWAVDDAVQNWQLVGINRADISINGAGDLVLGLGGNTLDPNTPVNLVVRDQNTYCTDGSTFGHDFAWGGSFAISLAPPTQTVTYNANTGSGSVAASVANGARALSDGTGLINPGFTFAGWNTAANGSGTAVAGGASYTPSGNVTLYAQWNRIPTPPAPAFTSPISVAPVGGVLNLTGANMAAVTSITVDDMPATVSTSSSGSVTVKLPTLAPGKYDITIKNADGGIRFIDGLVVPDPNAKVAPKPTTTYVASTAVKVTGSTPSAKQTAAVKAFVAQYKDAKSVNVFVRTNKAGLAAAKKAAAAMLATAIKALGGKIKGSVIIDSTSEKSTALDLVVND